MGVKVERQAELLDFKLNPDSVVATIKHADDKEEIVQTPWLIGCDGAHSRVRHVIGQGFPGEADPHQYVLADVVVDAPPSRDEWHGFLTDSGTLYFTLLPAGRTFLIADIAAHHDAATEAPTLDDIQALVAARGPHGARVSDPRWLGYFRIHYRLARHYREGRTFMAGDAVHIHSPIGGQGMNTGIQDAYNLAWKLALVMRGKAPESLLDSYEIERRQVGEDVVRATKNITDKAEVFSHLSPAARAKLYFNVVIPEAERIAESEHREELDLDYRQSPICVEAEANTTSAAGFRSAPHAGAQTLDAGPLYVNDRMLTLFELLRGTKHSVLIFAGAGCSNGVREDLTSLAAGITRNYGTLTNVYFVYPGTEWPENLSSETAIVGDPELSLHKRYGAETACLYLIRPDGYVAFRSHRAGAEALQSYFTKIFF